MNNKKDLPEISEAEIEYLSVQGARVHNLKNIDIDLPRNKLVVITGVSGSGKSSLAFDTIYAEGQRRYLESFSAYARQFIGGMERPDVEKITGLSPVISIEQKTTNKNPRSTVGTITEIYDFMRLLFARAGEAYSRVTGEKMVRYTESQIFDHFLEYYRDKKIVLLAPVVKGRKGHYRELFESVRKKGYLKVRVDGEIQDIKDKMQLDRYKIHDIEVVIDRLAVKEEMFDRLKQSMKLCLKMGDDQLMVLDNESGTIRSLSKKLMDPVSGESYDDPSPNSFSFNSPYGACPECKGLGVIHEIDLDAIIPEPGISINDGGLAPLGEFKENYAFTQIRKISKFYKFSPAAPLASISEKALNYILYGNEVGDTGSTESSGDGYEGVVNMLKRCYNDTSSDNLRRWAESYMGKTNCPLCHGTRLKSEALNFKIDEKNISELAQMDIRELADWFVGVEERLSEKQGVIAKDVLKEIRARIGFLMDVGLEYLTLDRQSRMLSGGESQRIRLATQIGSQLTGITYILDEPSIGLHQRDNNRLITSLKNLRDTGNTVLVVEHDKDIMMESDYIIDIGPGAGNFGGEIVGKGTPDEFIRQDTTTAQFLRNEKQIEIPAERRIPGSEKIVLMGARGHNLQDVNIEFPMRVMICITGVSGSGKSSLVNETLYPILRQHLYNSTGKPLPYNSIHGIDKIDKVIDIDQSPIGRTPRSNPATYISVFSDIRTLFTMVPEAKIRGYKPGRFSFNVKGGRCEECEGAGVKIIEMNFLPDVTVDCEKCLGRRYNRETLEVRYKGKSISDVLDLSINDAVPFFENHPKIYRKLKSLQDVGLGYITLGQSAVTLSGGEAQRVKLSAELSKKDTGNTVYILDEPTTGLHFEDIRMLLNVLQQLVDKGNTVLIIEHNLDVIKVADYIIDMGPEGGSKGGLVVAKGTPEEIAEKGEGYTAEFLKKELGNVVVG